MLKKAVLLFLIAFTLNACVSKKVYQELETKFNNLRSSNSALIKEKDDLLVVKKALEDDLLKLNKEFNDLTAQKAVLENGKSPKIVELPMPTPLLFDGINIPASYANFLILNQCVLVPTFNDVHDREALNIIANCFPTREVIGISAIDLIWGFGTLHCLSQQIPE